MNFYGITISVAIICSSFIAEKLTPKGKREILWGLVFWSVLSGIMGARFYHVIHYIDYYLADPVKILYFFNGGLGIWGGLIGGTIGGLVYLQLSNQKILQWLDIAGVCIPLGQAIGRWGNFFNKEMYGSQTNLYWGININGVKYHPLFIYESVLNSFLFLFLLKIFQKNKYKQGDVFFLYLIGYSMIRFLLEFLKTDSWKVHGLNISQCMSILFLIVSFIFLKRKK